MGKRFIIFAVLLLASPVYAGTFPNSYSTKTTPVVGDKLLGTDSENSDATVVITTGSLPISTSTQAALDLKANTTGFALNLAALSDLLIDSVPLVSASVAYGDATDNQHVWPIETIGGLLLLKPTAPSGTTIYIEDDCTTVSSPVTGDLCFEY